MIGLTALAMPALGAFFADPALDGATVAAIVTDLNGKVLFARDINRRVTPASNQKLFSVAYALDRLGSAYRAPTKIAKVGDEVRISSDGTLDMSYARMKALAEGYAPASRVLLRESYRPGWNETWNIGDAPNRYAPFICAFSCEKAGMELWAKDGEPEFRPAALGAEIERRTAPGFSYDPFHGRATVGPLGAGERRLDTLSQPEPDLAAARLFAPEVQLVPTVEMPEDAQVVYSASIGETAPRCLQPSDNFLAESLFEMAKAKGVSPRDWAQARVALTPTEYSPADGSGISRRDEVTVGGIAKLLRWANRQSWGPLFRNALAKPGVGTLKSRLKDAPFQGKTGTLTGVSSLSGYVRRLERPGGTTDTLIVSLVFNHYACPTERVHAIQDAFVRAVARL